MPLKRALVECTVLALQDSCVFYPYCKGCFSRIGTDSEDTRLTCSKCGYSCARSLLDYRYRLSIRVARGSCMFGVTVFGNCLNQFFGIHASGFQRLLADKSRPLESSKSILLKAVEECFIGKHFIFGIKVAENDSEPWVENTTGNSDMAQLIATQMILPKAAGLMGCTVLNCYEAVLQKAAETKQCTVDPDETAKLLLEPLWPIQHNSPTPGFTNDTLHSSGFLPLSFSRSHLDSSLSPTPPWQKTLGLITSSAEQEECTKDDNKSPRFSERCRKSATPLKAWWSLTPPAYKTSGLLALQVNDLSTSAITKSIQTTCPAQDEFPLSESLTEFLKDKNKLDHSHQNSLFLESVHDDIDLMDRRQICDDYNEDKTAGTHEASEDEQSEGSIYNCSADLFSNSPRMDVNTAASAQLPACNGHASVGLLQTESLVDSSSLTSKQHLSGNENDQKQAKCILGESFRLNANFDFIPPSQSTPAERAAVPKGKPLRSTKENINGTNQTTLHCCATPKSRYTKPDKNECGLLTNKHFSARRGVLNSAVYKRRSSGYGAKVNALIVPPTPAHLRKTSLFKYKEQTFNVTSKKNNFQTESECKSSECGLAVDESECNNADEECDWSRDLFSDSL